MKECYQKNIRVEDEIRGYFPRLRLQRRLEGFQHVLFQLQQDENTEDAHTMADLPRLSLKAKFFFAL